MGKKLQRSFRFTPNNFRPAPAAGENWIKARKQEDQSYSATSVYWARSGTQKDAWWMGAGAGDKIRSTDQKHVLCSTHVLPPTGQLAARTGAVDSASTFLYQFPLQFALELYPCPSGYFYLRKQKCFSQKTCFQIKLMRLVLTPKATLFLFHSI